MAHPGLTHSDPLWYKDTIIYELHVRAFYDSNGDGIGDFPGLTQKLDYLQDLGVTALWLLPFYPSPLRDDAEKRAALIEVLAYAIGNLVARYADTHALAAFQSITLLSGGVIQTVTGQTQRDPVAVLRFDTTPALRAKVQLPGVRVCWSCPVKLAATPTSGWITRVGYASPLRTLALAARRGELSVRRHDYGPICRAAC